MRIHFFTAPFYLAFIWFKVPGSRFRVQVAASPPFFRRWYSRIAAFPSRGRCPAGADRVLSLTAYLRHTHCLFRSTGFHAASTLSGSLRSPPSPRGEGFVHRYCFSTHACIRSVDMGIAVLSYRSLPHGGRLGIWERGRTIKKANRNGSPFLVARLACVSEVAGRYRAKARKRAGLERCDRVSCGIQFISRGRYFDLAEIQILYLGSPRGRILYTDLKFHIDGFRRGSHSVLLYGNHR